jgi:hypothetical protein
MSKASTPPQDRLFIRAVDEAEFESGHRINLTDVALDDEIRNPLPLAKAWAAEGYGTHEAVKTALGGDYLAFTFSEEGFARASQEAERLRKQYRKGWRPKWPEIDGTSTWLAIAGGVIALIYHLLIGT